MIIYRPHRGGLAEAMELRKEFKTEKDMFRYIYEEHKSSWDGNAPFDISDIVIVRESAINDNRIGWHNSMYVCVKRYRNQDYIKLYGVPQCIGMCSTDYERS